MVFKIQDFFKTSCLLLRCVPTTKATAKLFATCWGLGVSCTLQDFTSLPYNCPIAYQGHCQAGPGGGAGLRAGQGVPVIRWAQEVRAGLGNPSRCMYGWLLHGPWGSGATLAGR